MRHLHSGNELLAAHPGLTVSVHGASWYGHSTVTVMVTSTDPTGTTQPETSGSTEQ